MILDWKSFSKHPLLIDIRPFRDFKKCHLPGALSIPFQINLNKLKKLYSGEQLSRETISCCIYEYEEFLNHLNQYSNREIGFYDQNEGLRLHYLRQVLPPEMQCFFLNGSFDSYYNGIQEIFEIPFKFIKLTGLTGSGKTLILEEFSKLGLQTLNLEQLASHKGSAFGEHIKLEQPEPEKFVQDLAVSLEKFDIHQPVFLEQKPSFLGKLKIPEKLQNQLNTCERIYIERSREDRLNHIVNQYGKLPKEKLSEAIVKLKKRLQPNKANEALEFLKKGDLHSCAHILLTYYDEVELYEKSRFNSKKVKLTTPEQTAAQILAVYKESVMS